MSASLIIQIILAFFTFATFLVTIGMYLSKVNRNEKDIHKLDERYYQLHEKISDKLDKIYERLPRSKDAYVENTSPMTLTKKGRDVSNKLLVHDTIEKYYDVLYELLLENKEIELSPYDIQQYSLKLIREKLLDILSKEEKDKIKAFAFNEGAEIEDFLPMYGIILRDKILKDKNINIKDVDTHNPKKIT